MNYTFLNKQKSLALVCLLALIACWHHRYASNRAALAQTNTCGVLAWDGRFGDDQGVNGVVLAIAQAPTGEVFVGGRFTRAGNVSANNIAYWQPGTGWHAFEQGNGQNGVGGLPFAEVNALAVSGEVVYVGGRFTQAGGIPASHVARWTYRNGWQPLLGNHSNGGNGVGGTGATHVYALALDGEDVYVGGNFRQAGNGSANPIEVANIARWHPTRGWQALAYNNSLGVDGYVTALLFNAEGLFVGGNFTRIANGAGAYNVAVWRNVLGWEPLNGRGGQGVGGGGVTALAWFNNDLYVAGEFTEVNITSDAAVTAHHIARWNARDGWRVLMDEEGQEGVFGDLYALAVANDTLYVAGRFTRAGAAVVSNLAAWHPTRGWQAVGTGLNAVATAAYADNCELYLGGAFTSAGGSSSHRFARYAVRAPGSTPTPTPTSTPTPTPNNPPPTITPQPLTLQQGNLGGVVTLASISDAQTPAGSLQIQLTNTLTGVTVTELANVNGSVVAKVLAACGAPLGIQNLSLRVTDGGGAFAMANIPVTVTANSAPGLGTYSATNVIQGGLASITPTSGVTDNGFIANLQVTAATFSGTVSVAAVTGIVTIGNANPAGTHAITVTATDNCGLMTTRNFTLNVIRPQPTPTPTPGNTPPTITPQAFTIQQGSVNIVTALALINDSQTPASSLQVQLNNPVSGVSITDLTNMNGSVVAKVTAACNASLGGQSLSLRVTDAGGAFATANLPITVAPNSVPVVGNYATANVTAGNSITVTPSSGLSDNGAIVNVQANSTSFNGTLSVAAPTGLVTISNARPAGTHTVAITVVDNCGAAVSRTFTLNVARAETVTRLTLPTGIFAPNQSVALTATVSSAVALGSAGAPTGSVGLYDGTHVLQRVVLGVSGTVRFALNLPAGGWRELRAQYEGDAQYNTSASPANVLNAASQLTSASAASYQGGIAAPEQLLAAFGARLSDTTLTARTVPLPLVLNDLVLRVRDAGGTERLAPLFFISPNQINYLMPAGVASGIAALTITSVGNRDDVVATGTITIANVAPGLFSADGSGAGWPSAQLLRVSANGALSYEPVVRYDEAQNRLVAVPINFGAATDQLFLILFGTGIRGRTNLGEVTVTIGEIPATVLFAGAQGSLIGVDQINLALPRALAGRGEVELKLFVQGKAANALRLMFR